MGLETGINIIGFKQYQKTLMVAILLFTSSLLFAQQGFFLDDSWGEKKAKIPACVKIDKTTMTPKVKIVVDFCQVITKISPYLYGHCVSQFYGNYYNNDHLLKNIQNLRPNILRYPAGSGANYFYWNRSETDGPPADISVSKFKYGISNDTSFMSNENFYTLCKKTNSKGINVINYSYARYGTNKNPVATAAHLAADWVRYDNGRTKYWEIGNENYGAWEEGYKIDVTKNNDHQPEIQTGTLYGQHFEIFADSMRKAAKEIGVNIKLGAVCYHNDDNNWNHEVISKIGNTTDFIIVHKYIGQKRKDADFETFLNAAYQINLPHEAITNKFKELGIKPTPIALTEWNTNYQKAGQKISYLSGMFEVLALGTIIQSGYGMASRWNLVWKSNNSITHGLFNGNKNGKDEQLNYFQPRPAFYYLYYFQKFFGNKMIACSNDNSKYVQAFASSFSDGNSGLVLVNKSTSTQTVNICMENFTQGVNYYWYILNGDTSDGTYSAKLFVNQQNNQTTGGPLNYEEIKAYSCNQEGGIYIELPPLSTAYTLIECGI